MIPGDESFGKSHNLFYVWLFLLFAINGWMKIWPGIMGDPPDTIQYFFFGKVLVT